MKIIFLKDNRLRGILADRNKEIKRLLLNGTIKGKCYTKLATKELKDGEISYGWEITDLESGQRVQEGKITPSGTITALKDYFKPLDQL